MLQAMDDVRVGRILRALRRRRGWTQKELGRRAKVSQQAISLIERGHGERLSGETVRRVFAALDARWEPTVSWRGGDLDRLLDEEHGRLVGEIARRLADAGWEVAVEVTYSEFGERGSIDVLGARRDEFAIVVVEVKSELTAIESTLRKLDEKVRIVQGSLGRERFGFRSRSVGRLLVLPSTNVARRRVGSSSEVLDVAFPDRAGRVRGWLRAPEGTLAGIQFVSFTNPGSDKRAAGGSKRVRGPRKRSAEHGSSPGSSPGDQMVPEMARDRTYHHRGW
jgi:transcriptional regulator with XRE-family HTH domain